MRYPNITTGIFLARPNRFIAHVEINGAMEVCHVKNTGRCRELLVPGCRVYLVKSDNPTRKTRYDLVAVEKERADGPLLVNMDAQAPNQVFGEWAASGAFRGDLCVLRPETIYGNSRFDYYWEQTSAGLDHPIRGFVEVKGVTLEENGIARFPDAPTLRGVKHLEELALARAAGYEAAVCFILQMEGMKEFRPNDVTHLQFGETLRRVARVGVEVLALECQVTPESLSVCRPVPVYL